MVEHKRNVRWLGLAFNLLLILPLWLHQSTSTTVLGRYSLGYGLALGASLIVTVIWLAAALQYQRVQGWIARLPSGIITLGVFFAGCGALGAGLLPIETQLRAFMAGNAVVAALWLILVQPDTPVVRWRWQVALGSIGVLIGLPLFLSIMIGMPYSPDEAHWADYATTLYVEGGVFSRTWAQQYTHLKAGVPWLVPAYGWLLEHIAYDVRIGRLWNMGATLLAIGGLGVVTTQLYGRRAAVINMLLASLSQAFFPIFDYRPDYQLTAGLMLLMACALAAQRASRLWARIGWHGLVGFLATSALNLHAGGIFFAGGFTLYYGLAYLWQCYRARRLASPLALVSFGMGAALGTGIYYLTNVVAVGGLSVYLDALVTTRFEAEDTRRFLALSWISLLEAPVIMLALLYVLRRRNAADLRWLGMALCVVVCASLLDTQGYYSVYRALYIIPVGALLLNPASSDTKIWTRHEIWTTACLILALVGQIAGSHIQWSQVRDIVASGTLPPYPVKELGEQVAAVLRPDDIVASTHEFIWAMPHEPKLYSAAAEITLYQERQLPNLQAAWDVIRPTVVVHLQQQMEMTPGLLAYMEQHNFQLCQQIDYGLTALIYRPKCDDS
jgi:hypothetical protein